MQVQQMFEAQNTRSLSHSPPSSQELRFSAHNTEISRTENPLASFLETLTPLVAYAKQSAPDVAGR